MRRLVLAFLLALTAMTAPAVLAKPPLSAFSNYPENSGMVLSPDGKRIAWIQRTPEGDAIIERNLETGKSRGVARADGSEMTGLRYLTNNHLQVIAFQVRYDSYNRDVYRGGAAHIYDLSRDLSYRMSAFGRLIALSGDEKHVYSHAGGRLFMIAVDTGNIWSDTFGRGAENEFAITAEGKVAAAQDINSETGLNRIMAADGNDRRVLFEETGKPAEMMMLGLSADARSIIVEDRRDGARQLRTLGLADGALSEPLFGLGQSEANAPVRDRRFNIVGASAAGLYPRYEFFDAAMTADAHSVRAAFPGQAVSIVNWSDDGSKLLVNVEGGIEPGRYVIFDRTARKLLSVLDKRPDFPRADMGESVTIEYPARDGQKIGAVVTWPARLPADQRKNLPLVVLPHNEPDSYSRVGFNWIAQFLANEGYAVLEPNYRGSGGQGAAFRAAGHDQFGRTMQHDVTDGVHALSQMGWVDKDRVCIMGEGWGGYMALVGGAITPDRYRCVAAIGAITDLPDFYKKLHEGDQRFNARIGRWRSLLGDADANWTHQNRYSPVNLANQFSAPVLLIHTEFDWLSPDRQSRKMEAALNAAEKRVKLLFIPRENELLMKPESRVQVLRELADFLAANMTPLAKPAAP
jgi:dienelactone hydrolase